MANVNLVVTALIWLMIYPMMLKIEPDGLSDVRRRPKGLILTLIINWLIKPFTMAGEREQGTPVWRPVYDGGETVRFFNDVDDLVPLDPDWEAPRYAYVQHASDPVTFWNVNSIWSPSPWMDEPRGPDVPEGGPWMPFVTGIQGVFDLMAGFGAPPGHGHDYRLEWPGAWAQVIPPDEWTAEDTRALNTYLVDERAPTPADVSAPTSGG